MAAFKTLDDLGDVTGKVALVRVDLNLPMKDGSATDLTRAEAVKPTILELSKRGAKVLMLAHFGRPKGQRSSVPILCGFHTFRPSGEWKSKSREDSWPAWRRIARAPPGCCWTISVTS